MAHLTSSSASFSVDNESAALTDISGSVNNVTINGGNGLVQDTGLGDQRHTEIRDIDPINTMSITYMINSTTEAIFGPLLTSGTSLAKTVEYSPDGSNYYSGESNVGPVSHSSPVGLQTGTAEFRSTSNTGFDRTSVAL